MFDDTMRPGDSAPFPPAPTPRCVLIADDDADIREALRVVLEDEGYTISEAADGEETLTALRRPTPLVVLLDLIMPQVSGFEVLMRALRDDDLRARHAFIVLTAEHMPSPRVGSRFAELVERYQIHVVAKPFQLDDLLHAIAEQSHRLMPVTAATPDSQGAATA